MSALNRLLIGLIGLLTLAAGLTAVVVSLGLAAPLASRAGLGGSLATTADPVWPTWVTVSGTVTLLSVAAGALVLAVLAAIWLLGQVPVHRSTRPLRLDARDQPGSAVVEPAAVERAVEDQLTSRVGVIAARVELRGAATEPQLFIRLLVEDTADLPGIMAYVHTTVAADLGTALQCRVDRLGLTVDLGHPRRSDSAVRIAPAVSG